MTTLYSLKQIAGIIAAADGRRDADAIGMQLKGAAQRGVLKPVADFYGPRGALLFSETEVYAARLMLAAVDAGVETADLLKVGLTIRQRLEVAVDQLFGSDHAHWTLQVARIRDRETDKLGAYATWTRNGEPVGGAPNLLAAPAQGFEIVSLKGRIESVLVIRATDLLAPIWREIRRDEVAE